VCDVGLLECLFVFCVYRQGSDSLSNSIKLQATIRSSFFIMSFPSSCTLIVLVHVCTDVYIHYIGLAGPVGVGKSALLKALLDNEVLYVCIALFLHASTSTSING
jgi:alpha-D-ribose 1-methylphosphonate 5-triphosphate synthase subunit PhnL